MTHEEITLLTIQEAARFLSLHPNTVWRMCKNGKIPGAFQIGGNGRWRIKKELLEREIVKDQTKEQ